MTYNEILKFNLDRVKKAFPHVETSIGLTKEELAKLKNCSVPTIDRAMADSDSTVIPEYVKGKGRNGRVFFPLINVAMFLTNQTIKVS